MKTMTALLVGICLTAASYAGDYVSGHLRSNGTYVAPHFRTSPNATVRDNYSYKGNYNPNTGSTGTNYYRSAPSSSYYNGGTSVPTYRFRSSR